MADRLQRPVDVVDGFPGEGSPTGSGPEVSAPKKRAKNPGLGAGSSSSSMGAPRAAADDGSGFELMAPFQSKTGPKLPVLP